MKSPRRWNVPSPADPHMTLWTYGATKTVILFMVGSATATWAHFVDGFDDKQTTKALEKNEINNINDF